jgi:hypothetical protein
LPLFRALASDLSRSIDEQDDQSSVFATALFHRNVYELRASDSDQMPVESVISSLRSLLVALEDGNFLNRDLNEINIIERSSLIDSARMLLSRHSALIPFDRSEDLSDAQLLRRIIPDQSPGPVKFSVQDNRLVVVPVPSQSDEATVDATDAARGTALELGEHLIRALTASNCDPRLLRSVVAIQQLLSSNENVIRLGILNSGLTDTIALLENELAAAVTLDLRTYSNGIRLYVGQFESWAKFLENAINAELTNEDGAVLAAAADRVVQACKDQPEFADPEVPKTIIALRELLNNPAKAGKRAMFAMLRTLENLCVVAFDHIAGTADDTVKAARKTFSKAAGAALGGVLLVIAAQAAGALGPIGTRVPELKWVDQGLELAKKLTPKE